MKVGIGGAPMRASTLPTDPAERKKYPLYSGVFEYFPDALCEIARISWEGNNQHNPGQPLNWNRSKSADEGDTMLRHLAQAGEIDTDGRRHTGKAAWRILALLQKEIETASTQTTEPARCTKALFSLGDVWRCDLPPGHRGMHRFNNCD